eukprot:7387024-Prymnesium_polylepis.1
MAESPVCGRRCGSADWPPRGVNSLPKQSHDPNRPPTPTARASAPSPTPALEGTPDSAPGCKEARGGPRASAPRPPRRPSRAASAASAPASASSSRPRRAAPR